MFVLNGITQILMDIDALYQLVGMKIRNAREEAGISQTKLAKALGMSRASVVNIEAGRQRAPLHILWQVAEKLGIELVSFIPQQSEYEEEKNTILLKPEFATIIEEAVCGDPAAKRDILAYISTVKSNTGTK
jgi:transcriptional regulator with XRE-family HTH domain